MKSSMDRARGSNGRVADIEQKNRELGGFLDLFARLPAKAQDEILSEIAKLKEECSNDPEAYLAKVKVLAEMYGAIKARAERERRGDTTVLTFQLGEIKQAASELLKVKK